MNCNFLQIQQSADFAGCTFFNRFWVVWVVYVPFPIFNIPGKQQKTPLKMPYREFIRNRPRNDPNDPNPKQGENRGN